VKRDLPYQAGTRLRRVRGRSTAKPTRVVPGRHARVLWTLGNLFMLIGIVLLVYIGGVYVQTDYDRYAARGDNDVPAPVAVSAPAEDEPALFAAPVLNAGSGITSDGQLGSVVLDTAQAVKRPTVTRMTIPSIDVDAKVVEVGWDVEQQGDQQVAIWQVAKYAVGQHRGSANPGEGGNVVLAGHVGGYGKVFKDLFYVKPGDHITLYSNGQQYLYTIEQRLLVTEEGVSTEQHDTNAQLIAPTDREVVTLVTCWPPQGRDRFTQRVIVQAVPFTADPALANGLSRWMIR
jgi:sortase A